MIRTTFAHEEEVHESNTEAITHYAEAVDYLSYIAIPLFVVFLVLAHWGLKKVSIPSDKISLILLILLFLGAIGGLIFVPILGMFSIVLGFAYAGVLVLGGIKNGG